MDVANITAQLDQLDGDMDKMEETVKPLIANFSEIAAKLPLLDKAKLYVLAAYTIETALFNALRLQGIDAKKHPIFTEITRIKQYFAKIKSAEEPPAQRSNTLDKQAAIRFIKADLADNSDINIKLKEQLAKERAKAAIKAAQGKKRPAEEVDSEVTEASKVETSASPSEDSGDEGEIQKPEMHQAKRSKSDKTKKARRDGKSKKKTKRLMS